MAVFSHFELLSEIGSGATAAVWKARHLQTNQVVALKIFFPEFSRNPFFRERSHREFLQLKEVESPRILRPLEWVEHEGACALALDYVQGETLEKMQTRLPYVLPELSAMIVLEILRGLKEAHARGWVHRDLKPANILIDHEQAGRVLISDFGLARLAHQSLNHSLQGKIVGSPDFMSPELARGESGDARSDLFSISALFYFLVTGTKAFQRDNVLATLAAVLEGKFERVQLRNPRVSAELAAIIQKGLSKKPADRFSSAADYIEILENYLRSTGLEPSDPILADWLKYPSQLTFDLLQKQSQFLKKRIEDQIARKNRTEAWAVLEHLSKIAPESPEIEGWLRILRPRKTRPWRVGAWTVARWGFAVVSFAGLVWLGLRSARTVAPRTVRVEKASPPVEPRLELPATSPAVVLAKPIDALPLLAPQPNLLSNLAPTLRPTLAANLTGKNPKPAKIRAVAYGKKIAFDLPAEVKVILDGKEITDPSAGLARPRAGQHELRLEKPGSDPIVQSIVVKPNEEVNIRAR